MIGPSTKIKDLVKQFTRICSVENDNRDSGAGTLTYLEVDKPVDLCCEGPATLCFIRGEGKMAMNDTSAEYRDGKWLDIPRKTAYQILPNVDTVMLTIEKPTNESSLMSESWRLWKACPEYFSSRSWLRDWCRATNPKEDQSVTLLLGRVPASTTTLELS